MEEFKNKIKNIVAFCILMQNDGGILEKHPDYIIEKFKRYCLSEHPHEYEWGLDIHNRGILDSWIKKWLKE